MTTPTIDSAIRTHIDQFLSSISHLVRQTAIEAVKNALGVTDGKAATPARRGPGRPRKVQPTAAPTAAPAAPRGKPGRRGRRSPADIEAAGAKVLAYVKANPGSRLEEIGRGLKLDTAVLKGPVKSLVTGGQLKTEGLKRGTKYLPGSGKAPKGAQAGKRKLGKRGRKAAKKK